MFYLHHVYSQVYSYGFSKSPTPNNPGRTRPQALNPINPTNNPIYDPKPKPP